MNEHRVVWWCQCQQGHMPASDLQTSRVGNVGIYSRVENNLRSRGKVIPKMNTRTPPHRDSTK